jgi:hypothetical protein
MHSSRRHWSAGERLLHLDGGGRGHWRCGQGHSHRPSADQCRDAAWCDFHCGSFLGYFWILIGFPRGYAGSVNHTEATIRRAWLTTVPWLAYT